MIDYKALGAKAAERIVELAAAVNAVEPSGSMLKLRFKFEELGRSTVNDVSGRLRVDLTGKPISIYSVHLDSDAVRKEFLLRFDDAKARKLGGLAYPRLNKPIDALSPDCLYVGTSRNSEKRLREHLGFGDDRTYSLHLAKWAEGLSGGVEIHVLPFALPEAQLPLLTHLEDTLALELKPMLGRRGNL